MTKFITCGLETDGEEIKFFFDAPEELLKDDRDEAATEEFFQMLREGLDKVSKLFAGYN